MPHGTLFCYYSSLSYAIKTSLRPGNLHVVGQKQTVTAFVLFRKQIEIVTRIVVELVGVADIECFYIAEDILCHIGVFVEGRRVA